MVVILIVQAPTEPNFHPIRREHLSSSNTNTTSISFVSSSSSSQVDPETYSTTKEEEWVTKKKVELTTKRQIETRVKRQVVLEDGKVVEDSGPIVTTNTTEDTEKQESSQTEHREVGDDPPDKDWVAVPGTGGLVKEVKERKVRSREEKEERLETEDVQHLGDISDDIYLNAIQNNRAEGGDLRVALEKSRGLELQKTSPKGRVVHQSTKTKKVVDTEDSQHLSELQQDGRILTETRKTTEHEEVNDTEEPDDGSSGEEEDTHKEASHRYTKTKDQELVEYLADGKKIGEEMRYEAENVEGDRHGDPSNLAMEHQEWESLSTRIRKMRRNKLQQLNKGAEGGMPIDRKDALTKKPLDFDQEEETRKVETSKWLENHFGSESRSSKGSIDDEDIPATGTSTSFINVTMKSTKNKTSRISSPLERSTPKTYPTPPISSSRVFVSSPEPETTPPSTSYFQGISEWKTERDQHKERQTRTSFSPSSAFKDRVQVLPTGPNHTFTTSTSPSPPFSNLASSSLASKNYRGSQSSNLNGRNSSGPESPSPFQASHSTEKYSYNRYYSERDSPSNDNRTSSPMYPGHRLTNTDRSSPYERSSSPYHAKIIHNGKTTSSEEDQRSSSPRHRRRFNGHIEREDDRYTNEEQRSSSRFIQKESYPRLEEPAPDYSPPSDHRGTPSPPQIRSTPPPDASKKKVYQRTRFAADIPPVKPKPQTPQNNKSGIGESFRKLVGKFRSASSERKKEKRKRGKKGSSRSPSPHGHTYQQYNVIDNNLPSAGGKSGGGESTEAGESNDEQPVAPPRSSRHSGTQTLDRRERSTQTRQEMERRRTGSPVVQKYYLGEDPFGGSIYGREKEYDGVTPFRRKHRRGSDSAEEERNARNHQLSNTGSSTLGRLSKSTGRLINERVNSQHTINHVIDYTDRGGVQTLPRKLHDEEKLKKQVYTTRSNAERVSPSQQHWEGRYNTNNTNHNSSSMINVSIVNKATSPPSSIGLNSPTGPAKPARTYRSSLLRSKSFNVQAGDVGRDLNSVYKSNPHLHRLDESPPPLKSPGIVTSISRSTKDISEAVNEEDDFRRPFGNYNQNSFTKSANHINGYSNSRVATHDTKKKIFMKGLMDRAPELYKTLHGDEVTENHKISADIDDRPGKMYTSTPLKNGHKVVEYSSSFRSSNTSSPLANGHDRVHSPNTGNSYTTSITRTPAYHNGGEITNRSVTRRGSNDDYTETVRITSKSDDPVRPSVTNTVQSYTKKIVPTKNGGHSRETIESSETKTVTSSRYRGGDHDVKYLDKKHQYPTRNGGVIIEVRNTSK